MRISDWSSDVCSSDLEDGAEHDVFRKLLGFGFDHHHRIAGGGDDQVELAGLHFVQRGVELIFAILVADRTSVVWGKSVSVRVDLGGRRIIKKKNIKHK